MKIFLAFYSSWYDKILYQTPQSNRFAETAEMRTTTWFYTFEFQTGNIRAPIKAPATSLLACAFKQW
jgi:hypothetical protein